MESSKIEMECSTQEMEEVVHVKKHTNKFMARPVPPLPDLNLDPI